MTNSNTKLKAEKILNKILQLLDEDLLKVQIDERINKAITTFKFNSEKQFSLQTFHKVISDFIKHLYENSLILPKKLSPSQACSEAISILEQHYQGAHSNGYYAAYLDASNPQINGIKLVLTSLEEIIKIIERQKYIKWVFTTNINPSDWQTKYFITEVLIERFRPFLPHSILKCPIAQFVDYYYDLIINHLTTTNLINQIATKSSIFQEI